MRAMPRTARKTRPGLAYHVIWRFVDRGWYFIDDEERDFYLHQLGRALATSDWRCVSYALMSNHVHLHMLAGATQMEGWTKRAHSFFARWMNRRHGRLGPLFADRPKDYAFLPANEGQLLAYIHNNPVRAGVVQRARDSTWTSHRAYVGLARRPQWLHVDLGMARVGLANKADFDAWIDATPGSRCDVELTAQRRSARSIGGVQVATPLTDGRATMTSLVAKPYAHIRPDPRRVIDVIVALTGCGSVEFRSRNRDPRLSRVRMLVVQTGRSHGPTPVACAHARRANGTLPRTNQKRARQRTRRQPSGRSQSG
jgi:hypothetical protein